MSKSPAYIFLQPSGYYFCLNVPADLRGIVKKTQIRHPLDTRLVSRAKFRAAYLAFQCRKLFLQLRAGAMKKSPTKDDVSQLVQGWLRSTLDMAEDSRVLFGPYDGEIRREEMSDLRNYEKSYRRSLGRRSYGAVEQLAEGLLNTEGFAVDRESYEFKKLCRELMKANIVVAKTEIQRSFGKFDDDLPAIPPPDLEPPNIVNSKYATDSILISALFDKYEKEMLVGKTWRDKTSKENRAMMNTLVEILGDLPVTELNKGKAREYKAGLQRYPRHRHKDKRYRNQSLDKILAMPNVDTVSVTTLNNHIIKISALFQWAVAQGYLSSNPFKNLTIRTSSRAIDDVLPLDQSDLIKIFHSPLYVNRGHKHPWQFWIAPIGLFSGMRLEEICQLHIEDIKQIDGIWCFDVNDGGERQVKTKSSNRVVPVHPELVRLGILRYANHLKGKGKLACSMRSARAAASIPTTPANGLAISSERWGFQTGKRPFTDSGTALRASSGRSKRRTT